MGHQTGRDKPSTDETKRECHDFSGEVSSFGGVSSKNTPGCFSIRTCGVVTCFCRLSSAERRLGVTFLHSFLVALLLVGSRVHRCVTSAQVTGLATNSVHHFRVCALNLRSVASEWSLSAQAATAPRQAAGGGGVGGGGWDDGVEHVLSRPQNAAEVRNADVFGCWCCCCCRRRCHSCRHT